MEEKNEKQMVEMTTEQAEAFKAFQEQQRKEREAAERKENRKAYAELVDDAVMVAIPELQNLSTEIQTVKNVVYGNFREILKMKEDVMHMTADKQRSHTFTHSNGALRLTLGVNTIDGYRDTVDDGIAMVKEYIESLATDDKSKTLVKTVLDLLAKDQQGNLKASRVLKLRRMAEEAGDDKFSEGVKIIEESYQPTTTKQYIKAEYKDEKGWHIIPLSVTDC